MQTILPAARGLRTLYALSSDKLWFALAILACLLIAGEVAERAMSLDAPHFMGSGLAL
ncbi:MAG: hypothetical protein KDK01_01700 [Rhodobacteraceae bacterium]|jgi:hypothetical protein|nr:hypothetical protein [Paracoccaceae bacterium]